jgi:ribosomal protein S18 acetylase RimI-like enzyme
MVLVHPDHRRQGIGRALLEHALGHLEASAAGVIELDASAEGRPLYASLGFESEWPLSRWEGRAAGAAAEVPGAAAAAAAAAEVPGAATVATVPGATPSPARGLHPPARADWDDISLLDEEVLGTRRRRLLEAVSRASYATLVLESAGDLLGYGMIRPGAHADYLGPVIARTREAARVLVAALLQRAEKSAVFWDFPDRNAAAAAMAGALGFRVQRSLTRMRRGEPARPSQPLSIFGITDLATG